MVVVQRRPRRAGLATALALSLLLGGCTAGASGATPSPVVPGAPVTSDDLGDFSGVAVIDLASRCTATLIDTGSETAPAYLLTNGHCVGLDGGPANRTIVDEEVAGEATFFQTIDTPQADRLRVPVVRIEYATMRGRDLAIVRLGATLGELRRAGAVALPLAASPAPQGRKVVNIAAPTEGIDDAEWGLRRGECRLGKTTDLIEFSWLWLGAQANDCPGVLGGSSGSPLIAGGEVVSMINTTNAGVPAALGETCYLGKPCEIRGSTAEFVPNTSYGVAVAGVGSCFVDGGFTLSAACPLQVARLGDSSGGGIFGANGVDSGELTPQLELRSGSAAEVAVSGALPLDQSSSCANPLTYPSKRVSVPADTAEPVIVDVPLPSEHGFVLVCAAVPGSEADAARFVFATDTRAPSEGPALSVERLDDGGLLVDPIFAVPEIANILVLSGDPDQTDCSDRAAYLPYRRQAFLFDAAELPVRFCAVGFDMAGNESPVTQEVLPRPERS